MIQLVKRVGLRYDQTNFLSRNNFKGKLKCDSAQLNLFPLQFVLYSRFDSKNQYRVSINDKKKFIILANFCYDKIALKKLIFQPLFVFAFIKYLMEKMDETFLFCLFHGCQR